MYVIVCVRERVQAREKKEREEMKREDKGKRKKKKEERGERKNKRKVREEKVIERKKKVEKDHIFTILLKNIILFKFFYKNFM